MPRARRQSRRFGKEAPSGYGRRVGKASPRSGGAGCGRERVVNAASPTPAGSAGVRLNKKPRGERGASWGEVESGDDRLACALQLIRRPIEKPGKQPPPLARGGKTSAGPGECQDHSTGVSHGPFMLSQERHRFPGHARVCRNTPLPWPSGTDPIARHATPERGVQSQRRDAVTSGLGRIGRRV